MRQRSMGRNHRTTELATEVYFREPIQKANGGWEKTPETISHPDFRPAPISPDLSMARKGTRIRDAKTTIPVGGNDQRRRITELIKIDASKLPRSPMRSKKNEPRHITSQKYLKFLFKVSSWALSWTWFRIVSGSHPKKGKNKMLTKRDSLFGIPKIWETNSQTLPC